MKTRLMKTGMKSKPVALLVSAGLFLLLVSGIQGSGQRSSVGGFERSDATIRGDRGNELQGTAPVPPPLGGGIQNVVGVVMCNDVRRYGQLHPNRQHPRFGHRVGA